MHIWHGLKATKRWRMRQSKSTNFQTQLLRNSSSFWVLEKLYSKTNVSESTRATIHRQKIVWWQHIQTTELTLKRSESGELHWRKTVDTNSSPRKHQLGCHQNIKQLPYPRQKSNEKKSFSDGHIAMIEGTSWRLTGLLYSHCANTKTKTITASSNVDNHPLAIFGRRPKTSWSKN